MVAVSVDGIVLESDDIDARPLSPIESATALEPVRQVSAKSHHAGIVTDNSDLYMYGTGFYGQLGLGDITHAGMPTRVAQGVRMVACGVTHVAAVTNDGRVFTYGDGWAGKLGHGNEEDESEPKLLSVEAFQPEDKTARNHVERIVMVATGSFHTVALSEAGRVYTWGYNGSGQLGLGEVEQQLVPRQVESKWLSFFKQGDPAERVVFVAAGGESTTAVTLSGRLYTWGCGFYGQLGHGDVRNKPLPTLVRGFGTSSGSGVVMAACSNFHTLVVTRDGDLWACGKGSEGQLGLNGPDDSLVFRQVGEGIFRTKVVTAAVGPVSSAAVTEDGALWAWGALSVNESSDFSAVPFQVHPRIDGDTRVGRCSHLPHSHALAFAMGTHKRIGSSSLVYGLSGEVELLRMIVGFCATWVPGEAGQDESLVRLIGGVSLENRWHF